jgi:hypothetical protein
MAEKFVLVASFSVPYQAELARNRLQAEGVPVLMVGEIAASTLGFIGPGGQVRLEVPEDQFEKARAILAECMGELEKPPPGWEAAAEQAEGLWVCPLCGSSVSRARFTCPDCGTARGPDAVPAPDTAIQSGARRAAVAAEPEQPQTEAAAEAPAEPAPVEDIRPPDLNRLLRPDLVYINAALVGLFLFIGELFIGLAYLATRSLACALPLLAAVVVALVQVVRVARAPEEADRSRPWRGVAAMTPPLIVLGVALLMLHGMLSTR